MRIPLKYFTQEIRDEYNIIDIEEDGYVFIEIRNGMYGSKEASILVFNYLVKNLAINGYHPVPFTAGSWNHETRQTTCILCVDDFGIKAYNKAKLNHLLSALRTKYEITIDPTGSNYIGLFIEWNYDKGYVDISMPYYMEKLLQVFLHTPPIRRQHSPHKWTESTYGQKVQYALPESTLTIIDKDGIKHIQ